MRNDEPNLCEELHYEDMKGQEKLLKIKMNLDCRHLILNQIRFTMRIHLQHEQNPYLKTIFKKQRI